MYKSTPIIIYKSSDTKENLTKTPILYNSAPHLKTSSMSQEGSNATNNQNSPNSMRRSIDDKKKTISSNTIKKVIHYTNSEPQVSISPKAERSIYQVLTDIPSESESVDLKSDVCLCYDQDGIYNFFELSIVCQQIKCIGQYKTSTTSYDLIQQGFNAFHCKDGDNHYLVLSKHILKPKNIILVQKKLSLNIDQFIYYPIYVICSLDMEISHFESLFPYLLYNLLID